MGGNRPRKVTPATKLRRAFFLVDDGIPEGVTPQETNRFERNNKPQLAREQASEL
jgi:hypothetical protein